MTPTVFSYTRLSAFDTCEHQYVQRYLRPRTVKHQGIEAFVGQRVHEVIEAVECQKLEPNLPSMWEAYRGNWQRNYHSGIVDVRGYGHNYWMDYGEKCVTTYYDKARVPEGWKLVGVEYKLGLPLLSEPMASFVGIIDRLIQGPQGEYKIQDFKTGKMGKVQYFDKDHQLPIYAHLVQRNFELALDVVIPCERIYLAHDARCHCMNVDQDRRYQAWWWAQHTAMEAIVLAEEMVLKNRIPKAQKIPLCDWCAFKKGEQCPVWALSHPAAKAIL